MSTVSGASARQQQAACRRWMGHTDAVTDVQPSRGSAPTNVSSSSSSSPSLVASTSDDRTIRIWQTTRSHDSNATTTRCLRYKANDAPQPVSCCAWYTHHGGLALLTAHTRCIAVWELHTCAQHVLPLVCTQPTQLLPLRGGEERKEGDGCEEHELDEVNQLTVSGDGSLLAACDDTGRWYSWRISHSDPSLAQPPPAASSPPLCPPALSFEWLGCLHSPHDNLCSSIALIGSRPPAASTSSPPSSSAAPLVLSAGFDYKLYLTSADGKHRIHQWNVNEWMDEQRMRADGEERAALAAEEERWQQTRSAQRKGRTAAERLRERIKQKHTAAAAAASHPEPRTSAQSSSNSPSSPLTNPPFPHCLAVSSQSQLVLLGLGNGQLALLDNPLAASHCLQPLLIDAHAHAVVSVAWIGRANSGCEYWVTGGSDRSVKLWRSAAKGRRGDEESASGVEEREGGAEGREAAVASLDRLDRLAAVGSGADSSIAAVSVQCVWSVVHGWKVNSVSCESGAASVRLFVADVSQRVAIYDIT